MGTQFLAVGSPEGVGYSMIIRDPKIGDLAIVCSTAYGDNPWVRKMYRTGDLVLIICDLHAVVAVLHDGQKMYIDKKRLEVVSEGR